MDRITDRRNRARLAISLTAGVVVAGCALIPAPMGLDALGEQLRRQPQAEAPATPAPFEPAALPDGPDAAAGGQPPSGDPPARFTPPRKWQGPFALDLYRRAAHVPQFTASWCVGASMQMMINLIGQGPLDRTRGLQQRLYRLARKISPWVETEPGAGLYGWAGGLEQLGYGTFQEQAAPKRQAVLKLAARQMRLTNKPVGLWVWRGKHAWVMSGFKATADPAVTNDFRVTAVWIEDPWSGRVSTIWGPGLAPHTLVSARELGEDFLRWSSEHRPEYGPRGRFVILAPTG